jgi:hypothetical protein
MRIVQYILYSIADILFTLFAVIFVNWWIPFLAVPGNTYVQITRSYTNCQMLPSWLKWFDTFDASIDAGWADKYFTSKYTLMNPPSYWLRKWYQVLWLYRNPAYGFGYWVLGETFDPQQWKSTWYIEANSDFSACSTNKMFNVERTYSFLKIKFGWKAWNYYQPATNTFSSVPWGPELRVPHCFSIIPQW